MTASQRTLTHKTARGVMWIMAQTVTVKVVTTLGQIVLAWLLLKEDWGLVGLAYTVTTFTDLIYQAGIREVLIQRQKRFARWATPAFWMSLTFGLAGMLITAALAPAASWLYFGDSTSEASATLTWLILILALAAPFGALAAVPKAKLEIQLRYRAVAAIETGRGVLVMALTIALAAIVIGDFRFGAFAFVIPKPLVAALRTAVYWRLARPRVRRTVQFRRWRYLLGDSGVLLLASLLMVVTTQGDRIVLGRMFDEQVVGGYFFAYNLSNQTIVLFTVSLANVLLPALSQLQKDSQRQRTAFVRAAKLLAILGVPTCVLLAACADPIVHAMFHSRWYDTVVLLQLLSLGMALRIVNFPSISLLKAQGRFRLVLFLYAIYAVVFMAAVWAGATLDGERGVAAAVAIYSTIISGITLLVAIRPAGGTVRDVMGVFASPVIASALAVVPAWGLARLIPDGVWGVHWWRLLATGAISVALYVPIIRALAPEAWRELRERIRGFRRTAAPAEPTS